ncbi:hypothetical protein [Rickettsiella endosymbiont of Miltochrista miniata]|uniref:hypothetical protein n=1 Tax=Rickettsiella endosymbiont of Miltochrista miniata TaxID=3066239 RepID=UPI00313C4753
MQEAFNKPSLLNSPPQAIFFTMLELLLQLQHSNKKFLVSPGYLEKYETFLDEIFLQGKFANFQAGNFNCFQDMTEPEFDHWKAYLAKIANNQKIDFFTKLLLNEEISLSYFKIQIGRYQIKSLKKCCFFTLSKNIRIQQIDQLPLPKLLKENLTEFVQQQGSDDRKCII